LDRTRSRGIVRLTLLLTLFAAFVVAWASAVESAITLPVWGGRPSGFALTAFGFILLVWGLLSPEFARWFPRPVYAGVAVICFGVSMVAGSRAGLWLISPVVALTGFALAFAGYGVRRPLLPPDDDSPPTLHERIRFWFACAVPWIAIYEFTVHMRLPGRAFQFEFEDQLQIYPITSLLYQSTYAAVTVAPFLARTRRELRRLTVSAWVATAFVFPFYWLVPSTAPRRPMTGDHLLAKLLSFERSTYPPTAAFPSFHVLWSILIGRLLRPQMLGWLYALGIAVSCITTGMHYIPDVLVSFAIAPLFIEPERFLWRPLLRTGLRPETLKWSLAYLLLGLVVFCIRSSTPALIAGVLAIGVGLLEFVRRTPKPNRDRKGAAA